ncbi:MAG: hypothetical protein COC16_05405 [Lutibacter sp.]|nr:MAG: hypothetical protein COC16_05405 [Lutibacter sp.]
MKKLIVLFLAFSLFSCNDGDFDVPVFEFTDTVNSCGEYILYVANSDDTEVLVLSLNTTHINNELGEATYSISSALEVTYRIFEDGIGTDYFCQSIPPTAPIVLKELSAESGTINITTTETSNGYTYTITISDLLFNDNDERILFETLDFGIFTITL